MKISQEQKAQAEAALKDEIELSSFAENLAHLNSLILQMRKEYVSEEPNDKRLGILASEANALAGTMLPQVVRVMAISGEDAPNISFFTKLQDDLRNVIALGENYVTRLEEKRHQLDINFQRDMKQLDERRDAIKKWLLDGDNAEKLNNFLKGETHTLADIEYFIANNSARPPRGPFDNGRNWNDDGHMNERITALEKDMSSVKTDVAVIRSNYATKSDLASEVGSLKSDIGTVKAEIHSTVGTQTWKLITWVTGINALLVGAVFYIARNIF